MLLESIDQRLVRAQGHLVWPRLAVVPKHTQLHAFGLRCQSVFDGVALLLYDGRVSTCQQSCMHEIHCNHTPYGRHIGHMLAMDDDHFAEVEYLIKA